MALQKSVRRPASRAPRPSSAENKAARPVPQGAPSPADAARFSRTEWLADILRERILNGTYAPGERIREIQLRNEFGFSNGPIREALQAIVAEGLAERAPWHGVRIKQLDERQLLELFQLRLALLEYAAELAARNRTEDALDKAAVLKKEMDAGFSEIDRGGQHPSFSGKLSQWLLTAAGNRMMQEVWDKTMHQTLIYVNASLLRSHGRKSRALIHALIDTICQGDVAAARQAARDLTRQTLVDLGIKGTL